MSSVLLILSLGRLGRGSVEGGEDGVVAGEEKTVELTAFVIIYM